jgi:hypothetical protein
MTGERGLALLPGLSFFSYSPNISIDYITHLT